MCGIAGIVDLEGRRPTPAGAIQRMAQAMVHRGPDEDGFLELPGLSLASRRLSIVGLFDGRQPIWNENKDLAVVFNGELFDYPERKAELEQRGHRFVTHCDTEVIPHLWEEQGEGTFERLHGQFALALWDGRQQRLTLGRDRFGICPLYWTRQGDWLLFASEIKALLASGLVVPRPDVRGIHHLFTFFALPGPVTCFQGVQLLPPGHFLRVQLGRQDQPGEVTERTYWEVDFPDCGQEDNSTDEKTLVARFEEVLLGAVERRLRADVPVVSYLSGGVDSSIVVAMASRVRGEPIPSFTIRIDHPELNEVDQATLVARHVGVEPVVVNCGADEVLNTYPALIQAAEGPVIDTSCAALLLLAREVHRQGYKVTQTGEGSDEWLAGYPWYKVERLFNFLNVLPGMPMADWARHLATHIIAPHTPVWHNIERARDLLGGHNAWLDIYCLMSLSQSRFFSQSMKEELGDHLPYADLAPNLDRMRRWHPFHRGLWLGVRAQLAGLLLNSKGDRVAMHSSVEARYPFLDDEVFAFLAALHPRWKLRGFTDKYLLRRVAERWLPRSIAWRRKAMFRAPFDSFFRDGAEPTFVDQLLSEESLRKTGYFDPEAVQSWRQKFRRLPVNSLRRTSVEMGLVGVVATQLWHQTFIDGTLADLNGRQGARLREIPPNGDHFPSTPKTKTGTSVA